MIHIHDDDPSKEREASTTSLKDHDKRMLSMTEVAKRLDVCVGTIERYRKTLPNFPQPIRLGTKKQGALRWDPDLFDAWLKQQVEEAQKRGDTDSFTSES